MWQYNRTKSFFSCAHRTTMHLFLLLVCVFSMTSCNGEGSIGDIGESNTTSGSVGPFVETSQIWLRANSFSPSPYFPGNGGLIINLNRSDTDDNEPLRVGIGDTLQVTLNDVPQFVEELRHISCSGKIGPCSYIYNYRVFFSENPDSQAFTISLDRVIGVTSHTTVTFMSTPTIAEPAPDTLFSLSTDTIAVSWQPGEPGDETRLTLSGDCGVYEEFWFMDAYNTYSFAPGTFQFFSGREFCANATELPLPIRTTRYRTHEADPALAPISWVELSLEDEIAVRMRP